MTTREEAAARAVYEAVTGRQWEKATERAAKLCREDAAAIVKAADAHDQANGIHRVKLDDHEREIGALIDERDQFHDVADKLAAAIAPSEVLGEHSSMNDPWANALEYAANTHRVALDDATVERAARALFVIENPEADWEALPLNQWVTDIYRKRTRAVLAAAVGGSGE